MRFEAIAVALSDTETQYLAKVQDPITIDGHVFQPLDITFSGLRQGSDMPVLAVQVALADPLGVVTAYLEQHSLRGHRIDVMVMQMGLLEIANARYASRLQIMGTTHKPWEGAMLSCGIDFALNEHIPGDVITREKYPGCPDLLRRGSVL